MLPPLLLFVTLLLPTSTSAAHLSPFSYIERGTHEVCCLIICLAVIVNGAGWGALSPLNLTATPQKRNRFLVTFCLLFSLFLFVVFDIICTTFKYGEGWHAKCDTAVNYVAARSLNGTTDEFDYQLDGRDSLNWTDTTPTLSLHDLSHLLGPLSETHFQGYPTIERFGSVGSPDVWTSPGAPAIGCATSIVPASAYSDLHKDFHKIAGSLLNWSWTLQSSGMFMFIAWTNVVVKNSVKLKGGGKTTGIMNHWEDIAAQT